MQWRSRRLVIAIISTGLIFAMTLVLTGLANGFRVEAQRTVDSMGVDRFVVKAGAAGPFLGATPFAQVDLARVAADARRRGRGPTGHRRDLTIKEGTSTRNTTAFGAPEHGPGMPGFSQGRAPSTPDEVAVSSTLGQRLGDKVQIGAQTLRIVGIVPNSTALAKRPNIFLTTEGLTAAGVQRAADGHVDRDSRRTATAPDGYQALDRAVGVDDLLRPMKVARGCDLDRGRSAVDRGRADRRIIGVPLGARAPTRLCGVQGDWRADAVDPGGACAAGDRRRAARGGAGRHPCAAAGTVVPDDRRHSDAGIPGTTGNRDCGRSAGQRSLG